MKTFIVVLESSTGDISIFKINAPNRQALHNSSMNPSDELLYSMFKSGLYKDIPGSELKDYIIKAIEETDSMWKLETIY